MSAVCLIGSCVPCSVHVVPPCCSSAHHHLSSFVIPLPPLSLQTDNYLIDAILDVPRTRQMYMRRLRTLMDAFQATGRLQVSGWCCCGCAVPCGAEPCGGRCSIAESACVGAHPPTRLATLHLPPLPLQQIITDMYNTIRDEAKRDAAKWQNPGGAGMVGHSLLLLGPVSSGPTQSPLLLPVHPRPWPCQRMTPSHPQPLPLPPQVTPTAATSSW